MIKWSLLILAGVGPGALHGSVTGPEGLPAQRPIVSTHACQKLSIAPCLAPGTIPSGTGGIPDDNSVTSAKIVDGEVKTQDLADNSIYSAKIQDGQVRESDLQDNAVMTNKIPDGAITSDKISSCLIKYVALAYDSEGQNAGWRTGNARHIITDPDVHGTSSVVVANVIYPIYNFISYHCFVTDLNEGKF